MIVTTDIGLEWRQWQNLLYYIFYLKALNKEEAARAASKLPHVHPTRPTRFGQHFPLFSDTETTTSTARNRLASQVDLRTQQTRISAPESPRPPPSSSSFSSSSCLPPAPPPFPPTLLNTDKRTCHGVQRAGRMASGRTEATQRGAGKGCC